MLLVLSTRKPWNANYCNEDGQIIFKVESPGLITRTIKISRVLPPVEPESDAEVGEAQFRDVYESIAEIEYNSFRHSNIKYGGVNVSVNDFFKKGGFSFWGRNRFFTGPDGKEYVWKLTHRVCKLFVKDSSNTPVAIFHRKRLGIIRKRRPASLEIFPPGQSMVDLILVTFVYLEKLRTAREDASRNSHAASYGGGGGG